MCLWFEKDCIQYAAHGNRVGMNGWIGCGLTHCQRTLIGKLQYVSTVHTVCVRECGAIECKCAQKMQPLKHTIIEKMARSRTSSPST